MAEEGKRTDLVAVVAMVVSLLALVFSGLQWWVGRGQLLVSQNQLLLSMKPSINFSTEAVEDEPRIGIQVEDAGPGPAVVRSVTYFLDRKPLAIAETRR